MSATAPKPSGRESDDLSARLETITKFLGLAAAAVALVYVAGGAVLALKLRYEQLPADSVVGHLPREFLISIGIAELVVPAAAIAILVAAVLIGSNWIWRARQSGKVPKLITGALDGVHDVVSRRGVRIEATIIVIVLAAVAVGASVAAIDARPLIEGGEPETPRLGLVALATILALALMVVVAATVDELFKSWNPRWEWKIVLVAIVAALVLAPLRVALGVQTKSLPQVLVCMTDPREPGGSEARQKRGLLIGETSERVYVGEPARTHQIRNPNRRPKSAETNRIASVPWSHIQKLYIAANVPGDICAPVGDGD